MVTNCFAIICISVALVLSLPVQAEESTKSEMVIGFNHDNPVAYTREGKNIGSLDDFVVSTDKIINKVIQETTPRRLIAIKFKDGEFKIGKATEDHLLWFRRSNLKLTISEQAPCPEVPTLAHDMTSPVTSGIGCR